MLIKTIIPINSVQGLKISSQPISLFHNHLNVRVVLACCSHCLAPQPSFLCSTNFSLWRIAIQWPSYIRTNADQSSSLLPSWLVVRTIGNAQLMIPPSIRQRKWRHCKDPHYKDHPPLIKPFSGVSQSSAKTCTHCISVLLIFNIGKISASVFASLRFLF